MILETEDDLTVVAEPSNGGKPSTSPAGARPDVGPDGHPDAGTDGIEATQQIAAAGPLPRSWS